MRVSLKTSFAAFVLSSALVGAAAPAFADTYYQGIDPHNPPGRQNRVEVQTPRRAPANVDVMPTGSIDGQRPSSTGMTYRERYQSGEGNYYRGIVPPTP
ncbi:hypothetical protein PYH37_004619 [Sinorhizobium numidicum]|uniref:Uncharacterized protein n=1 Tax=Sinorhizobium numidicum TaxID=680248 RepID=A0ABY8CZY3_9HYPH|nr:hypothetical protein [Sinorhizobium numidicum]WEX76321.1 hypothetical protein PYH37_004619 [Sinorhizobium numidicum]WEX82982.1 hypothetical protein PYH38_005331 [Sinorhizobium numidicum]